jgi:hypothetical protein
MNAEMTSPKGLLGGAILAGVLLNSDCAQQLAPRAYVITPLHSNAVILSWSYFNGNIDFNGGLP